MWDLFKVLCRRKFVDINVYIIKEERLKIYDIYFLIKVKMWEIILKKIIDK